MQQENQHGQGLVEYALIMILSTLVVVASLTLLAPSIGGIFSTTKAGLEGTENGSEAPEDPAVHVQSVVINGIWSGSNTVLVFSRVNIVDQDGVPVPGATVNMSFSQVLLPGVTVNRVAATDLNGDAIVLAFLLNTGPDDNEIELCITGVSHGSYDYDSGANVMTCVTQAYSVP